MRKLISGDIPSVRDKPSSKLGKISRSENLYFHKSVQNGKVKPQYFG